MSRQSELAKKLGVSQGALPNAPISRGALKDVPEMLAAGMPTDAVIDQVFALTAAAQHLGLPKPVQTPEVRGLARAIARGALGGPIRRPS